MFAIRFVLNRILNCGTRLTCKFFVYTMQICIHVYSNYNVVCLHMHCTSSTLLALSIKRVHVGFQE